MAPHKDAITTTYAPPRNSKTLPKPPPPPSLCKDGLQRTISDISFELSKEMIEDEILKSNANQNNLPTISEVEDAKCECCNMSEECTPEYITKIRDKYCGKWICGLCSEAVKEEMLKNGGNSQEAVNEHMSHCVRFNKLGRAYPVLCQAQAMREILKKSSRMRGKSLSPKDPVQGTKKGGIARSSSCIPAITREMRDLAITN